MGNLPPDNGADDNSARSEGLPDLPPEWGTVVIPDDASELDEESDEIRRELRQDRIRSMLGLESRDEAAPSVGTSLIIMGVAVLITLMSLFLVTWAPAPQGPAPSRPTPTESNTPGTPSNTTPVPTPP